MQYYIYATLYIRIYTVYSNWVYFSWPSNFFRSKSLYQTSLESSSTKKNRILGKYNHRNCHKKSLQNIRDLSVFSQRSRVQNPMLSLNILVETGIPHSWILIILNIFNSMFHHLSVISSYPHAPCVGYLPTFGPFLG